MANQNCRKFGRKNFGELKSDYIGNAMEMVKLAKNLANCYNLPKFFSVQYSIVKFFHIKVLRHMISSEIAASIPKY